MPLALARHVIAELVARSELSGEDIDEVVRGTVVPSTATPNVESEVALASGQGLFVIIQIVTGRH